VKTASKKGATTCMDYTPLEVLQMAQILGIAALRAHLWNYMEL